jgi:hypothetical protein
LPEGRTFGGGAGVEVGLGLGELFGQEAIAAKVFARVAEKKGVDAVVEPCRMAAPDTRFVVEAKTGRMWLDGCELDTLPDSGARILRRLAQEGGRTVPTNVLARAVSPNRSDDGVVRQAAARIGDWLRAAFEAKGLQAPADADRILEFLANKGWRLIVKCEVR